MKALVFDNYLAKFEQINSYLNIEKVSFNTIKFSNGEGKILIEKSLKDEDVLIFFDFSSPCFYKYKGKIREYSKDEYVMELKRLISAIDDAKSINVVLPLIYEGRQNTNNELESKDYLLFIKELKNLKVDNIITFEAHGEEKEVMSVSLAKLFKDLSYDVVVSPDEGGVKRARNYQKEMDSEMTFFTKKRDLNTLENGHNPIKEYDAKTYDFLGKNVLVVDDILDSGSTLVKALEAIDKANTVDVFACYALFSDGVKKFAKLHKEKKLNNLYISDLIYVDKKYLKYDFIKTIDTSEFIANLVKEVIK